MRYNTINDPEIEINVRLVAIHIAEVSSSEITPLSKVMRTKPKTKPIIFLSQQNESHENNMLVWFINITSRGTPKIFR